MKMILQKDVRKKLIKKKIKISTYLNGTEF